ncbi:MAG: NAD-dependent epimerase/dehydratase family protein [Balneolaceae bacterium]
MKSTRTLVIGLGQLGQKVLQNISNQSNDKFELVSALDDDKSKENLAKEFGFEHFGACSDLEHIVSEKNIEYVIIAITNANSRFLNNLIYRCLRLEIRTRYITDEYTKIDEFEHFNTPIVHKNLNDLKEFKAGDESEQSKEDVVLVTGGAGYIGNHLVRDLLNEGFKVVVLDSFIFSDNALSDLKDNPDLKIINGHIENIRDVFESVKNIKYVIALAAIVGDPACSIDAQNTMIINYESTKILVEACNYYGVEKLVFASSCSVYGASSNGSYLDEDSTLNPVSLYARTRIFSEKYILDHAINFSPVILRLSTVFGYSRRMRFDLVVNLFTVKSIVEKRIEIFGGNQWRPFVHCRDVAKAFKMAALAPENVVRGNIYNVGDESLNFTIDQIGDKIKTILPQTEIINNGEVDDPRNYKVKFNKIKKDLGFETSYDLESGIKEMIEMIYENKDLEKYSEQKFSNLLTFKELN